MNSEWKPAGYKDLAREYFSTNPKDVDGGSSSSLFWFDYLSKIVFGRFEFQNIPDSWDEDYMKTHLFYDGLFCVTDTDAGILPLQCGVSGVNVFNHPTTCNIANPVLGSFSREIGKDCEIVKLQYDYRGIRYMLWRYAVMLAECDSAISVNLMNSKVAFVFMASDKRQAESMRKLFDQVNKGEPGVFVRKDIVNPDSFFPIPVKNNFIANDVIQTRRAILNDFLSKVGLNNANLEKRERLNRDEVNANNEEIRASIQHWVDNIRKSVDKVNNMFSLSVSLEVRDYNEPAKYSGLLPEDGLT